MADLGANSPVRPCSEKRWSRRLRTVPKPGNTAQFFGRMAASSAGPAQTVLWGTTGAEPAGGGGSGALSAWQPRNGAMRMTEPQEN